MENKKVLIVDDEIHIVHVLTIKLRNNGYEVLPADNGAAAYEIACDRKPDVIVTDYQMPVMSGLQLIEKLRQNPDTADTPVVMLTARSFAIDDERKNQLRITEILSKPFSPRELLRCIEDILYRRCVVGKQQGD